MVIFTIWVWGKDGTFLKFSQVGYKCFIPCFWGVRGGCLSCLLGFILIRSI
ncbi:hypothetical protein SLEP1_g50810 [Rubroshorea leprosula]|uniref:Uncharacterized protein n=1 Tax=Rubroshorea leprosula TaxID=152421 RepID=A0AAV5M2L8_9ROSI|nr:hypothetical protein SLEP1_g50810 [Rubroshorea leprosula]